MRILAISQYYAPDITAAAFRIDDMTRWLSENGQDVTLLTAHPHKVQVGIADKSADGVEVHRSKLYQIGSGGLVRYLLHYFSFVVGSVLQGVGLRLRGRRFDVVWVSSPPLFAGLSGLFLSGLFRCPLVLEIRDIWPDTAVAAGQISDGGFGYRVGRRLEALLYRRADQIVCVSKPMRAYIAAMTSVPVSVIYNGVTTEKALVENGAVNPVAFDGKTLVYAGNIGLLQELDILIAAFADARDEGGLTNWRIRLIGAGPEQDSLRRLVEQLGLDDYVAIESPMARDDVFEVMRRASVLFVSLKQHPVLAKTIPSKVFDCMLAGRPILACIAGEGREILGETEANLVCDPGSVEDLRAELIRMDEEYDRLDARSLRNRDLVLARFTREQGARSLLNIFRNVSDSRD